MKSGNAEEDNIEEEGGADRKNISDMSTIS